MLFLELGMQWAEQAFAREVRAATDPSSNMNARSVQGTSGIDPDSMKQDSCLQCRRDMSARLRSVEPGGAALLYSPDACRYLRALFRDFSSLLSQDANRLSEWHRRAAERYRDHST
jgi:hypothetical protein